MTGVGQLQVTTPRLIRNAAGLTPRRSSKPLARDPHVPRSRLGQAEPPSPTCHTRRRRQPGQASSKAQSGTYGENFWCTMCGFPSRPRNKETFRTIVFADGFRRPILSRDLFVSRVTDFLTPLLKHLVTWCLPRIASAFFWFPMCGFPRREPTQEADSDLRPEAPKHKRTRRFGCLVRNLWFNMCGFLLRRRGCRPAICGFLYGSLSERCRQPVQRSQEDRLGELKMSASGCPFCSCQSD